MMEGVQSIVYWPTVPVIADEKDEGDYNGALASWQRWNKFRLMCDQNER